MNSSQKLPWFVDHSFGHSVGSAMYYANLGLAKDIIVLIVLVMIIFCMGNKSSTIGRHANDSFHNVRPLV